MHIPQVPEVAKDAMWIGSVSIPVWIADPQWIPPILLWGGLLIFVIRLAISIRDWFRKK